MRMTHYFWVFAGLLVPALGVAAWTGISKSDSHLTAGLISSVLAVGTHSLLIIFMMVTGRVLREAVRVRELSEEFLERQGLIRVLFVWFFRHCLRFQVNDLFKYSGKCGPRRRVDRWAISR